MLKKTRSATSRPPRLSRSLAFALSFAADAPKAKSRCLRSLGAQSLREGRHRHRVQRRAGEGGERRRAGGGAVRGSALQAHRRGERPAAARQQPRGVAGHRQPHPGPGGRGSEILQGQGGAVHEGHRRAAADAGSEQLLRRGAQPRREHLHPRSAGVAREGDEHARAHPDLQAGRRLGEERRRQAHLRQHALRRAGGGDRCRQLQGALQHRRRAQPDARVSAARRALPLGGQRREGVRRERGDRHRHPDPEAGEAAAHRDRASRDRGLGRQPRRLRHQPRRRHGEPDRRARAEDPARGEAGRACRSRWATRRSPTRLTSPTPRQAA